MPVPVSMSVPMTMPVTMPMTMTMPVTMPVAMPVAVSVPGERRHWKQHGSRDCANKRELTKHLVLHSFVGPNYQLRAIEVNGYQMHERIFCARILVPPVNLLRLTPQLAPLHCVAPLYLRQPPTSSTPCPASMSVRHGTVSRARYAAMSACLRV
jgi:hypothetical protein